MAITATPFRLDKKEDLGDIFTGLVIAPFPEQLIKWGFLTRPVYYSNGELDLSEVGEENGDFAIKDLELKCNVPEAIAVAVKEWQRLAAGRVTIAFADCLVLDQAGLVKRFSFIEDFREVSLNESVETESGEIPMKTCPVELGGCGVLTWIATPRCRQCGYDFVHQKN